MKWAGCLSLLSAMLLAITVDAQNLVSNGSFEAYNSCPGSYSRSPSDFRVADWRALTAGTPDYFNTCSGGDAAVPYNWAGVSDAYDGYGYAGIYTWMRLAKNYREYLHSKLTAPLIKDSLYQVAFRYKLSSYAKYSTDRIALLLSDSLPVSTHDRPLDMVPTIMFVKDSALTPETGAWELAVADYRAKGGEQYLTIGNFSDNQETQYYHIRFRPESEPMLAQSAYYYIDDVKVIPSFPTSPDAGALPVFTGEDLELNTLYVLKNIQFEFNSYALMPVSYIDLDKVIRYLLDHPDISVALSGHTDDVGEESYNRMLSENRARSAAAYLISRRIRADRISARGYGEAQPLMQGHSEEARDTNRRVEIEFFR